MPIYEYKCQSCQKITEARQSIVDTPLATCSHCQGRLNKVISQTSFQLKGGGWYSDGYCGANGGQSCAAKCPAAAATPQASAAAAAPSCADNKTACGG
ncbi:MAG: zinc ribbon domain-containing protein [Desulfobulbaceae bacterium]|nr:MAG: zinc ribbon domain-containing protein [Desulfobulbaceae bacterium]